MMATTQPVLPVAKGYAYAVRVRVTGGDPAFPLGCVLRADVRAYVGATEVAGSLSTADDTLVRIDDMTVDLHLPPALTAAIDNNSAVLDFARLDVTPVVWIGVQIKLPVIEPVTAV
jgi:hypothetical protein